MSLIRYAAVCLIACGCAAQEGEIGAAAGYGTYRNGTVYAPAGKATAGIRNRFAVSAVLSEEKYERLGGEIRYTYQDGDPFLSAGATKTNVQGQSHTIHYDALFHFRGKPARIRPYMAAGFGAKVYRVSGPANPSQPLSDIAMLTTRTDVKPVFTAGGGVKIRLGGKVVVRLDFRDYVTPFPKKLIAPAPFGTGRGFFQQFTPLVGVGYTF